MPNPNLSVNSVPPTQPVPSAQRPKLKKPNELFGQAAQPTQPTAAPDSSQTKAPPGGKATSSVSIVEPAEVTQDDIQWATALEAKLASGKEATPAEADRYQGIVQALQAKQLATARAAGITPEQLAWAAELENKSANGIEPTPDELSKYQTLIGRLNAQREKEQAGAQAPAQQPAPTQAPAPTQQPAPTQPVTQAPAAPVPTAPAQSGPTDASQAIGQLNPVVQPDAKPPVDVSPMFKQLDDLLGQKKYIYFGEATQPEQIRATGVQIWLDGKPEDRLKLSQKLVASGQSELLGRIMAHEETTELDIARLMGEQSFPVAAFMKDVNDGQAFLILNALATVATTGEPSSLRALEQTVAEYDRFWDREAPFDRLKSHLSAEGKWEKLPAGLRAKIDELLK